MQINPGTFCLLTVDILEFLDIAHTVTSPGSL